MTNPEGIRTGPGGVQRPRVAVVTGGSRGIGLAIAGALRATGSHVAIIARGLEQLALARAELLDMPGAGEVYTVTADVADEQQSRTAVNSVLTRFGAVDVLVNNASTNAYLGPLKGLTAGAAARTAAGNLFAPVLWSGLACDAGMNVHGGSILNVASIGGYGTEHGVGFYNATKAGLVQITRQLAFELGPAVRVNAIAPGLVRTRMSQAIWASDGDRIAAGLPMKRLGVPGDIAPAAVFLLSEEASWITGQTLIIDGGALARPING